MNYFLNLRTPLLAVLFLFSCNETQKKKQNITTDTTDTTILYSVNTKGTVINWTAYKFSNRLGVKGVFNNYTLIIKNNRGIVDDLLEESNIEIYTTSIQSGDSIRDSKLQGIFFKIFNTDTIKGNIKEANLGKGNLELEMNNVVKNVPFTYNFSQDTIVLSTNINVEKWKGEAAIKALNDACFDLHKGSDGISKLWPDVDIKIKIPVIKEDN